MIKECMDHTAATEEQKKDYRSGYFLPFKINSNCYFSNVLPRFLRMFMFFSCRCTRGNYAPLPVKVVRSTVQEKPTKHRNSTQRERLVHGKPAPGKERPPFRLPFS